MRILIALIVAALTVPMATSTAEACMNKMERHKQKKQAMLVLSAWTSIEKGHHRQALSTLSGIDAFDVRDEAKKLQGGEELDGVPARAVHAAGTAIVRSGGQWTLASEPDELTGQMREANLRWATSLLLLLSENDASAKAHWAEALALVPDTRDKAIRVFDRLNDQKLLRDRTSLRVYSDLLRDRGRTADADAAAEQSEATPAKPRTRARGLSKSLDDDATIELTAADE